MGFGLGFALNFWFSTSPANLQCQMFLEIPDEWIADPPNILVVGGGPIARVLEKTLGAARCESTFSPTQASSFSPRVFEDLEKVLLVTDTSSSPADILREAESVWAWVEHISSREADHELAFFFVMPSGGSVVFESSLAAGLGLGSFEDADCGHAVWYASDALGSLLSLLATTQARDLVLLRNRQANDERRKALHTLAEALCSDNPRQTSEAASNLVKIFVGREYQFDLFCKAPCHPNGNRLRGLLDELVTQDVTQRIQETMRHEWSSLLT